MRGNRSAVVLVLLSISGLPLFAGTELTFSARSRGSYGEEPVRGKATITVTDLNRVRYNYVIRRKVEAIDGGYIPN